MADLTTTNFWPRLLPFLKELAAQRGFTWAEPGRNLWDQIRDQAAWRSGWQASQQAARQDIPTYEALLRGAAGLGGQKPAPAAVQSAAEQIAKLSPFLSQLSPDIWDQLHGRQGSAAVLASRLAEAGRYRPGWDPEHVGRLTAAIQSLPRESRRGFTAGQLGDLYREASRQGLVAAGGAPEAIASSLGNLTGPASAVRDIGGGKIPWAAGLRSIAPSLASWGGPRTEQDLRQAANLQRYGGAMGPYGAWDAGLRAAAAASPTANELAAKQRWQASGLPAVHLPMFRSQAIANQRFIQENRLEDQVRGQQLEQDVIPWLQNAGIRPEVSRAMADLAGTVPQYDLEGRLQGLQRAVPGLGRQDASRAWGQAEELLGGQPGGLAGTQWLKLHSPTFLGQAKAWRQQAGQEAEQQSRAAHLGQRSWLGGLSDILQTGRIGP